MADRKITIVREFVKFAKTWAGFAGGVSFG
jgi:hypothetical protein